ncbi:beta-phosphoglucomutase [Bacillus suaedaesalsae]|uniref:beta-phosphoglucomutase n=1 Tax=Bacillus suaedaesalsae TaxID=2810349 RepID=UPI001EF466ED|nr:beta-phosphoglucomutase [Bacillus suaedaesalsae]
MIKAFIFDLDGVITDTAEYHYLAWKALAEEIGITFDREFNEKLKGVGRMDSLERILELGKTQHDFTLGEKEQLATKKNDHYKQLITNITHEDILPGIEELLKEIKKNGYLLGLASASKNAPEVLRSLGLYEQFDCIADAAAVEKSKPAPDIFLLAASMLKVEPSQCIGIEDAESGIEAIHSAGMFAVGVGDEESLKSADYYVSNTTELSLENILNARKS